MTNGGDFMIVAVMGDRFVNGESMFSIFDRPIKDSLGFLKDNYGILLKPIDEVKQAVLH
ncbi:MAG: dependent dehydrogenase [Clostridiaceae bacterium]|jgi:hypothetical protein|nr:dependent dehydrogenase [Clostridiaceae bacterium]